MPEGDTIFRTARTLHRALAGRVVTRFETVHPSLTPVVDGDPLEGRTVEAVSARGKHLLIQFSGGLVLRTHMRMNGSWHLYRPGERWRRPPTRARIVVGTAAFVAVGFEVPDAEFVAAAALARGRVLGQLGPDLLATAFDAADAVARLRRRDAEEIATAVVDQRALAGAGNIYKSEALFLCGINPFSRVSDLTDADLLAIVERLRTLLAANAAPSSGAGIVTYPGLGLRRREDPGARFWVYRREGQPCRRCGGPIAWRRQGPTLRSTYWCPVCQPATAAGRADR